MNSSISSRDRVLQVIKTGKSDRIPKGELVINDPVIQSALNCEQVGFTERQAFVNSLNLDIISLSPVYPTTTKELPRLEEYLWPDLEKWTKETSLFSFAILDGAFEWGMRVFGFTDYFIMLKKSPDHVKEFVQSVEKFNLLSIKELNNQGINGIILADDIAYQKGLLIPPDILKEYFLPSLARQVEGIKRMGTIAFYHSDGDYRQLIDELVKADFDGFHCIDRNTGMKIEELQQRLGDKLCLWGHLDINDVNSSSDPDYRKEQADFAQQIGWNKKFILGTNSGIFEGMDINSLKALYESI